MTEQSQRATPRKPYVPPKLTYYGQMNEIVMSSGTGDPASPGGGRGGSVWRGFKDRY